MLTRCTEVIQALEGGFRDLFFLSKNWLDTSRELWGRWGNDDIFIYFSMDLRGCDLISN